MYHPQDALYDSEYVELYNAGAAAVDLANYRFDNGIDMGFPSGTLIEPGGYLVVCGNPAEFAAVYPGVTNNIGSFAGNLDNAGERVTLSRAEGGTWITEDTVQYNDKGEWPDEPDGLGPSLELMHPGLPNDYPEPWRASSAAGTPGAANSAYVADPAPIITEVAHDPALPFPYSVLTVAARVLHPDSAGLTVTLHYRRDQLPPGDYAQTPMRDDGLHGDGEAGDGIYAVVLPGLSTDAILDFHITATDADGPAGTGPEGAPDRSFLCFFGDDSGYTGEYLTYHILMRQASRQVLEGRDVHSDELLDATLVLSDGRIFYNCGVRYRGSSARIRYEGPMSYRVELPAGRKIEGVKDINLNAVNPVLQCMGMHLFRRTGRPAPRADLCRVWLNEDFLSQTNEGWLAAPGQGLYARVQKVGDDLLSEVYPGNGDTGNLYRAEGGGLEWLGTDPSAYTSEYEKVTNVAADDWQDLIDLCSALNQTAPEDIPSGLLPHMNLEAWIDFFAIHMVLNNNETCIANTQGGDYYVYLDPTDGRFDMLPWDMDSVLDLSGDGALSSSDGLPFSATGHKSIWMTQIPAITNWLRHPKVAPLFVGRILDILDTTMSADELAADLDELGTGVNEAYKASLLQSLAARRAFITNEVNFEITAELGAGGVALVGHENDWRYFKGTTEPSASWRTMPDAALGGAWLSGPGGIGYGDGDDATVLSDMQNSYSTVYIRQSFVVEPGFNTQSPVVLRLDYDDGFVAYLNGSEIARVYAAGYPPAYSALATGSHEAGAPEFFTVGLAGDVLALGTNILAVQGLNQGADSSDFSLIADLFMQSATTGAVIIVDGASVSLAGKAPQANVMNVLVNGSAGEWDPVNAAWYKASTPLANGLNRIPIEAVDGDGLTLKAAAVDVICAGSWENRGGTISSSQTWAPASGLVKVAQDVVVNPTAVLTIAAGTAVLVQPGVSFSVYGTLQVQGSAAQPAFLAPSDAHSAWSVRAIGGSGSVTIQHAELAGGELVASNGAALLIEDSVVRDFDGYMVAGYANADVTIRRSRFARFNETHFRDTATLIEDSLFEYFVDAIDCSDTTAKPHIIRRVTARHAAGSSADGIDFEPVMDALVEDCLIYDVTDRALSLGGGCTNVTVRGCVIYDALNNGIGVKDGSWANIYNNTIVDCAVGLNLELDDGPGYGHAVTTNNIFWGNAMPIRVQGDSTLQVAYSDVQLGSGQVYPGTGNINADPLFRDAALDDFRLSAGSPCAGTAMAGADMGAFFPVGGMPRTPAAVALRNLNSTDVAVSWRDESSNETRFEIERSTDALNWALAATTGANVTNCTDTGLVPNTTYFYRLRAAHAWGASYYSPVENITTTFSENTQACVEYLRLTEIMYHPKDAVVLDDGDEYEFLELKNTGPVALDLSALYVSDSIDFTFPQGTVLQPGGFFVLARYATPFAQRYPGVTVHGTYGASGTKLSNSGELIRIKDADGSTVLSVEFADTWYPTTDGDGYSLVMIDPEWDPDLSASWRASTDVHGSPGADDPMPVYGVILINEVLSHTDPPLEDAIELYNADPSNSVHVGNWFVSDNAGELTKYKIPSGTYIAPLGYLVLYEADFNYDTNSPSCFEISSHGEEIWLSSAGFSGNLTGYRTMVKFGAAENGVSFGRYVRADGRADFEAMSRRTFGADNPGSLAEFRTGTGLPNAYPRVGPVVINEIMYHPAGDGDEFVELRNITGSPVPLHDPAYPSNTWMLGAAVDFFFPTGKSIPANGYALVTGIDPAVFRARYGIDAAVEVFGPYAGKLDNAGESVKLYRPDTPEEDGYVPCIRVDRVKYNDRAPWPEAADGDGPSLERIDSTLHGNDPCNWTVGYPGGTPGEANNVAGKAILAAGGVWRYRKGTLEASYPRSAWRQPAFDDSGWAAEPAPFGYGDPPFGTTLADMYDSYTCLYMRRTFSVESAAEVKNLALTVDYDDGFIAWINGVEVKRVNVDPGVDAYNAVASAGRESGSYATFPLAPPYDCLLDGLNTIAVQAYNIEPTSSDFKIDVGVTVAAPLPLLAFGRVASYASEYTPSVGIGVFLSGPGPDPVTCTYAVTGGTAAGGGADYAVTPGTLTFAPGQTNKTIVVAITNDGGVEPPETVEITLANVFNARLSPQSTHTFTLFDDDSGFVAYNDLMWAAGQPQSRITWYSGFPEAFTTSGPLIDYGAGTNVEVILSVSTDDAWTTTYQTKGADAVALTDAYNTFQGKVACLGVMNQATLTFTNLDPTCMYSIVLYGNRENAAYTDRYTAFTLFDVEDFKNQSSYGAVKGTSIAPDDTTTIMTGWNAQRGYVAKFTDVVPGPDRDMSVQVGGPEPYVNAVMLGASSGPGLPAPLMNPAAQMFTDSAAVTLSCARPEAAIHYTTDATTPTQDSPLYSGPLAFTNSVKLKAKAFLAGFVESPVTEGVFTKAIRVVTFEASTSGGSEANPPNPLAVQLTLGSSSVVTVDYAVTGGTATGGGVDYSLPNGRLTFLPGETQKSIAFSVVNDEVQEGNETLVVTLSNVVNADLGLNDSHTYTIRDNDGFFVAYNDLCWAAGQLSDRITLYGGGQSGLLLDYESGQETAVTLTVAGGAPGQSDLGADPQAGTDAYGVFNGIVSGGGVIGYDPVNLTLRFTGLEPNLRYELVLFGNRDNAAYTYRYTTVTVSDVTQFANESTTATNAADPAITLCNGWNTVNGYVARFTQLACGSDGDLLVTVSDNDSRYYANAVMLRTTGIAGGPAVNFSTTASSQSEALPTAPLSVVLSQTSTDTVSVDYAVTGGSATGGGADYALANGSLTFSPGQTAKTVLITVIDDTQTENNETVIVTLSSPANGTLGANASHTFTIIDNDTSGQVSVFTAYNDLAWTNGQVNTRITAYAEGQGGLLVDHDTGSDTTVSVAVQGTGGTHIDQGANPAPGTDAYSVFSGNVDCLGLIGYGPDNLTLAFAGLNPSLNYEFVLFGNRNVSSYTTRLSGITISDADAFSNGSTPGSDFSGASDPSTVICHGWNTDNGFVARFRDIQPGADGDFVITVADGGSASGVRYYANAFMLKSTGEKEPRVFFDTPCSSGIEPETPAWLLVCLDKACANAVRVDYAVAGGTASGGGTDFALAEGTLTFAPGQTAASVSVTVTDDALDEGDETLVVALNSPVNAVLGDNDRHTYTILDDERQAAAPAFTAYNDLMWISGQQAANITRYTAWAVDGLTTGGALVDFSAGTNLAASLSIATSASYSSFSAERGDDASTGTDAHSVFNGIVDCAGLMSGGSFILDVSGLDPDWTYAIVLFGNRDRSQWADRYGKFILSGADRFDNESTPGTDIMQTGGATNDTTRFSTGYNTVNGYVARFTRIAPGADGSLTLELIDGGGGGAFFNAFMLQGYRYRPGVSAGSVWKYRKGSRECSTPATAWRSVSFNDSGWPSGDAPFGYGSATYGTTLTDMHYSYSSLFLRRSFVVPCAAQVSEMRLQAQYDDGFILWLNGEEIARVNVAGAPGTFLPFDACAEGAIATWQWGRLFGGADLPVLTDGTNALTVQVFNRSLDSGDLLLDMQLGLLEGSPLSTALDADRDGMADSWETAYWQGTGAPGGGAGDDFDSDGMGNLAEFIAGTNPTNAADFFAIAIGRSGQTRALSFVAKEAAGPEYGGASRYYAVQSRTDMLAAPFGGSDAWVLVPGYGAIRALGQTVQYALPTGNAQSAYRVKVWLQP
ncbi:MAG: lamin tail domain-containing protein [Kiritimatiellae bacterium]|nr:lamin tail domain-containing protein [Kiritimatiellia bacterium]